METGSPLSKILFLGKYQFYLELLIPLIILMMFCKKRKFFWISLLGAIGVPCFLYWMPTLEVSSIGYNFNYIFTAGILFIVSLFMYDESPLTMLCATMISFAIQHIAWNTLGFVFDLCPNNGSELPFFACTLIFVGTYLFVYGLFFLLMFSLKKPYRWQKKDSLSLFFGTILITFSAVLSQYVNPWGIVSRIYTVVLMTLGVALEFIIPVAHSSGAKAKQLEDEKETLRSLLELQAKQSESSKKEQEILNMKFHDMKHQIGILKGMSGEEKNESLSELEKIVDIYGDYAKTGNETLDIILTQKALLCSEENVVFTYVIEGEAFSFMSASDLSALFGNIIDNAIESAIKQEGDYRLIKISAHEKNGFLSLTEENYVEGEVKFSKGGLPISTKENQVYHGFGTKSIKYIASKYHGTYSFEQKGNRFKVSLLFPLKKKALTENVKNQTN